MWQHLTTEGALAVLAIVWVLLSVLCSYIDRKPRKL